MPHDIFISYAHVDNAEPGPNINGWVNSLVQSLKVRLAQELGRKEACKLWMDYELRGNQAVTPRIRQALDETRLLVMFLSPGYLASTWCQEELNRFVERVGTARENIFAVELRPVEERPEALRDCIGYRFWRTDPRGRSRTMAHPQPDPTDRDYFDLLDDLANDLAQKIKTPDNAGQTEQPSGPNNHKVIYINAGADDLDKARQAAQALKYSGWSTCLPLEATAGFDATRVRASELRRHREDSIIHSDQVLTLYCEGPATETRGYVDAWTRARRHGKAQAPLRICQSLDDPNALGVDDPAIQVVQVQEPCLDDCLIGLLEACA